MTCTDPWSLADIGFKLYPQGLRRFLAMSVTWDQGIGLDEICQSKKVPTLVKDQRAKSVRVKFWEPLSENLL